MTAIPTPLSMPPDDAGVSSPIDAIVSPLEYQRRLNAVRRALAQSDLAGLLVYGDDRCGLNISYFCEFQSLGNTSTQTLLLLDADGKPILFVPKEHLGYATSVTTFEVCDLKNLEARLHIFTMMHRDGRVGMAGMAYAPLTLLERIKHGLGGAPITKFRAFMLMRLFVFWQRHVYGHNGMNM